MFNAKSSNGRSMNDPAADRSISGTVFDIHRSSMHDGPGIRTTIFLKGCPLTCLWCHNPESRSARPQVADAPRAGDPPVTIGRTMLVAEVMEIVRQDVAYYRQSGGGITISGGEPTTQWLFCRALLEAAKKENLHTCLDTSGFNKPEVFLDLLPLVDLFLWDYKATGESLHHHLTGVSSDTIRRNFELLYDHGASLFIRAPMIPGVNDSEEHLKAIANLAESHPKLAGIEILPYHQIGLTKFDRLHIPRPDMETHVPDANDIARWRNHLPEQVVIDR